MEAKTRQPHTGVGEVIARRLAELGRSQSWLAVQMQVSANAVSLWIRHGAITLSNLRKVAEVLDIPLGTLLAVQAGVPSTSVPRARPPAAVPDVAARPVPRETVILAYITMEEQELLRAWRETDDAGRNILRAVADQLPRHPLGAVAA